MEHLDKEKINYTNSEITYGGNIIDKNSIKAVYIEGMYSDTEYDENFNNLVVKLLTKNGDSYVMEETDNEALAKAVINHCAYLLKGQQDVKKYATSLINLSCVNRVGISDAEVQRVKVVFKDGDKVRIMRTKLKPVSYHYFRKINRDLAKYKYRCSSR